MKINENYYGRWFASDLLTDAEKLEAHSLPAMVLEKGRYYCNRCGSSISPEWELPTGELYCRICIRFGRIISGEELYYFPPKRFPRGNNLIWQGHLTAYQEEVSNVLLKSWDGKKTTWVHAVTGAGKTEMIYPLVEKVLNQGGQVCLASPRIDVCKELYDRLTRDFSCETRVLYGDSDPYDRVPLVIATTHQLVKFYRSFDLLIVDEVDAFPYVDDEMLYRATNLSVKEEGVTVFLTATSTDLLNQQVKNGQLKRVSLARRFHGYKLVVPKFIWNGNFENHLARGRLSQGLKNHIKRQRQTGFPLLIFYPIIHEGEIFTRLLKEAFKDENIAFVSSQSEDRDSCIQKFRQGEITILVSTTILERGVTFPKIDVFVVRAEHSLFSSSSLIQIAGRCGRASDRPDGLVYFFHSGQSKSMRQAVKEIKAMNREGGFI